MYVHKCNHWHDGPEAGSVRQEMVVIYGRTGRECALHSFLRSLQSNEIRIGAIGAGGKEIRLEYVAQFDGRIRIIKYVTFIAAILVTQEAIVKIQVFATVVQECLNSVVEDGIVFQY